MSRAEFWDARRNRITSRKGAWQIGRGVKAGGYSLLDDLALNKGFFDVLYLHVCGRLPERRIARWLEASFICLSFPDARIWCNQIGALGGTMRCSPTAAISAGVLASDSSLYGPGTALAACEFILDARIASEHGMSPKDFLAERRRRRRYQTPGFSRPIAQGDDRVMVLRQLAQELGFEEGRHLDLASSLGRILGQGDHTALNMLGYVTAFWLDQGLDAVQGARIFSLCVNAGVHACYSEAADEPAGAFLPLRCEDIEYCGKPPRPLPGKGEHA